MKTIGKLNMILSMKDDGYKKLKLNEFLSNIGKEHQLYEKAYLEYLRIKLRTQ